MDSLKDDNDYLRNQLNDHREMEARNRKNFMDRIKEDLEKADKEIETFKSKRTCKLDLITDD
jgi:hypothetical protein